MLAKTQTSQERAATFLRHGYFIAILFILAAFNGLPVRAQISPGPLAKAHQTLNGPTNCTKCHDLARGPSQLKCLECHTEIRDRIVNKRGLHATFVGTNPTGQECAKCHSDHNGVNFALVRWDPPNRDSFDHNKTGFVLEGKHAGVACEKCHKAENIPTAGRAGIQVKDLNRTYLGLSRNCVSCHTDEHRGQVGTDCARCHTLAGWKPAFKFNHAASKYPLTGAHEKLDCVKCHAVIQETLSLIRNTRDLLSRNARRATPIRTRAPSPGPAKAATTRRAGRAWRKWWVSTTRKQNFPCSESTRR